MCKGPEVAVSLNVEETVRRLGLGEVGCVEGFCHHKGPWRTLSFSELGRHFWEVWGSEEGGQAD